MYHNFIVFKAEYHTNVCAFHILFIKKIPVNLPSALGEKALFIRIHFLIFSTFLLYLLPMLYEMFTRDFIPFLYL